MKKSNDINKLFENARKATPLLKLEEVETLLGGTGMTKSGKKSFSLKKIIIMTTLISLIITTVAVLTNTLDVDRPIEQNVNPEIAAIETLKQDRVDSVEPIGLNIIAGSPNQHKIAPTTTADTPSIESVPHATLLTTSGVNLLQLNKQKLKNLGVFIGEEGISVPSRLGESENRYLTFSSSGTMIRRNSQLASILNANPDDVKTIISRAKKLPIPLVITDDLGQHWRAFLKLKSVKDIEETQARINTLVPILVRSGDVYIQEDSLNNSWRPDIILWYESTPEFLALLPNENAKEIEIEKNAIFAYVNIKELEEELKEISQEIKLEEEGVEPVDLNVRELKEIYLDVNNEVPKNLSTANKDTVKDNDMTPKTPACKYFESCKPNNKSIKTVLVYPNPTGGRFKVAVELEDMRLVTIHLTDISGKVAMSLHEVRLQQSGTTEYSCDISGLNSGVYLLMVETDKGERITQRVIKR